MQHLNIFLMCRLWTFIQLYLSKISEMNNKNNFLWGYSSLDLQITSNFTNKWKI